MGKVSGISIAFVIAVAMAIVAIAVVLTAPLLAEKLGIPVGGDYYGYSGVFGRQSDFPAVRDSSLKVEQVVVDNGFAFPTSMAFVGASNLLVLEKDTGNVRLVTGGKLAKDPVLTLKPLTSFVEQGLLGIAVGRGGGGEDHKGEEDVFLYITEKDLFGEAKNRVYRYDWQDGKLQNPVKILELPATPGPNHNGGKMIVGPDGYLYVVIGDLNRNGMLQNYRDGPAPDNTSVIIKVDRDGRPAAKVLSGGKGEGGGSGGSAETTDYYYAYGIRNSFGLAFDPLTGTLWDTENGKDSYDEVNVVKPGFNSGWGKVMGPISRAAEAAKAGSGGEGEAAAAAAEAALRQSLTMLDGAHYADPVFSWKHSIGVTDIEFIKSDKLGKKYEDNILVGDINNGHLYFLTVNGKRDGIEPGSSSSPLRDSVAEDGREAYEVFLGSGFGGITDIETGPDGYPYVLSFSGSLYRLVPAR
ncbi:MAG: PQQ-dependent sugar dehydrogenase [Thermoproteota archaeon]